MQAFYCEENDILVYADSKKAAVEYANYRLSPAYGHEDGRADNLRLSKISMSKADGMDGLSITWIAS